MNKKEIKQVAWVGDEYVKGNIKGVVMVFHGLGGCAMKLIPTIEEVAFAEAGGLVVYPYYGPWCWMNRQVRVFVDELIESIYKVYNLSEKVPLVSTGGSMGGLSALLYARYGRKPPVGCMALCPVCDTKYSYNERPDVPRTIINAFLGYKGKFDDILAEHSPLAQADKMPDIPYLIIHGEKDTAVSKANHSDKFVKKLRKRKLKVEYIEVPIMGHGEPMPLEVLEEHVRFVKSFLK